jgi:hypothetical protein
VQVEEFNKRYLDALTELSIRVMTARESIQRELYALAAALPVGADRERAEQKVYDLPGYVKSDLEPMSLERLEADLALAKAEISKGTKEEQLAAIAATRRKIFEIADRAGEDAHRIRYMTRPLDSAEQDLLDSRFFPWNDDYDPTAGN